MHDSDRMGLSILEWHRCPRGDVPNAGLQSSARGRDYLTRIAEFLEREVPGLIGVLQCSGEPMLSCNDCCADVCF